MQEPNEAPAPYYATVVYRPRGGTEAGASCYFNIQGADPPRWTAKQTSGRVTRRVVRPVWRNPQVPDCRHCGRTLPAEVAATQVNIHGDGIPLASARAETSSATVHNACRCPPGSTADCLRFNQAARAGAVRGKHIAGVAQATHVDREAACLLYTSPSPRDGLLS